MAEIVLLEDDMTLAEQIKMILESCGHSVTWFAATKPAIAHFQTETCDMLIADLFIRRGPDLIPDGGITLMSRVRQALGLSTPIIAISGSFVPELSNVTESTSRTVGANATLAKPFHPDDLTSLVDDLLRRRRIKNSTRAKTSP